MTQNKLEQVHTIVHSTLPISSNAIAAIQQLLNFAECQRGEDFISAGKANGLEYFLLEGICKSYLLNPDGLEVTIAFFAAPAVLSPHAIRTVNGVANLSFKALTDLNLATMDADSFLQLMINDYEVRNFANRVLQIELLRKVEKEIGMASLTAKERLLALRRSLPYLENRVPHADIATYLGITNVSLSRLRKEISKNP
jgi:CRP-like cAMP-binding protein